MSTKKYIPFALFLIIIAGLLVWQSSAPRSGESSEEFSPPNVPGEPVVIISYTNDGYEPSSVGVKRGETVRFMNDSVDQQTWPASAVHPTHSIYPESTKSDCLGSSFDACRGLAPGEHWDFKFNQAGEWRFHDHIHASKTGVVNVSE